MDERQNGKTASVVTLWLGALVAIATLASVGYGYLHDNELRFAALESEVSTTRKHSEDHERTAGEWKARIVDLERRIRDLSTNANSRPDPFTGTQGAVMERRIDQLERQAEQVKYLLQRIDDLATELRDAKGYYRRQVLPMLERSNSLQQQRIIQKMGGE